MTSKTYHAFRRGSLTKYSRKHNNTWSKFYETLFSHQNIHSNIASLCWRHQLIKIP